MWKYLGALVLAGFDVITRIYFTFYLTEFDVLLQFALIQYTYYLFLCMLMKSNTHCIGDGFVMR